MSPASVLSAPTRSRYERLAASVGETVDEYINQVLEDQIDQLEFEQRIINDAREVREGKQETIPLSEMMATIAN